MSLQFCGPDGESVTFECLVCVAFLPFAVSKFVADVSLVAKGDCECGGRCDTWEAVRRVASGDEIRLERVVLGSFVFDCS